VFDSTDLIPDELPLVPELLSQVGYETIGFCTNGQIDSLCEGTDAFDVYVPNPIRKNLHKVAGFSSLIKFLLKLRQHSAGYTPSIDHLNVGYLLNEGIRKRASSASEPLFLYAHYKDPHFVYIPPLPYLREYTADLDVSPSEAVDIILDIKDNIYEHVANGCDFTDIQWSVIHALYDASLSYTDERIGEIITHLRAQLDDTVFVVTGDHGELLGEVGAFGHRFATHDAACHVPLVVDGPTEIVNYDGHIQHIDVIRTLLAEVGAQELPQGYDLRTQTREWSIVQHGEHRLHKHLEEVRNINPDFEFDRSHVGTLTSIRTDDYVYERSPENEWLYSLPDETSNVASEYPEIVESFREVCEEFDQRLVTYSGQQTEISDERKKQLERMGYIVD
jgi:uncharacterized sulfatase